jgi:pimeloyl-ACP methyl ester carboxylesterase
MVPGGGHLVFMEHPEAVNEAILALLVRATQAASAEPRTA